MTTTIDISQETTLPNEQVLGAIDEVFDELKTKYTLRGNWKNNNIFIISGQGIIGRLEVYDECVTVTLTLGGVLSSFSSIIESQIREKLENKLNP